MDLSELTLYTVIGILEKQQIEYIVVGSFASSIHGMYRATADIDILIRLASEQIRPLFEALKGDFYVDELSMRQANARSGSFNAIHFESVFKVDFFVAGADEFSESQLKRRELKQLPALSRQGLYVASPEDTILAKLDWFRRGQGVSDSQWKDVMGIVKTNGKTLDYDYLNRWGLKLGLGDLLKKVLDEAPPSSSPTPDSP
jgi:hypothetical protein